VTDLNDFSQRVLADQRELDADPTPQTPTYALLAEERLEEAEALASRTVAELDGHIEDALSPRLVLLSEALIAHGITLARLKKPEAAQAALQRAITMAHRAGAFDKAALAALTMIEEIEPLPRKTLLSIYQQAAAGMANVRNRKLQCRLIAAAKKLWGDF
jgi:hypothetical protein